MKILIIGGSSVIGSKILRRCLIDNIDVEYTFLTNKIPYGKGHKIDITKKKDVRKKILEINPDVIIHSAALTNVDLCEKNHALADLINIESTRNLVDVCKITGSKFVYVSTSFVFDGKKNEYFEDDLTSPSTYYGLTKLKGEEIVKQANVPHLILRTDQPYCWIENWQHTNSVLRVIHTLRAGHVLKEVIDWYNCPTYVPNFVDATRKLLDKKLEGIFHIVGSNFINRYDWAIKTAEIFNLDKNNVEPITSDSLNLSAKRVNVNLNNEKLFEKTRVNMFGVKDSLIEMKKTEQK